jgi:hypothetical protein
MGMWEVKQAKQLHPSNHPGHPIHPSEVPKQVTQTVQIFKAGQLFYSLSAATHITSLHYSLLLFPPFFFGTMHRRISPFDIETRSVHRTATYVGA